MKRLYILGLFLLSAMPSQLLGADHGVARIVLLRSAEIPGGRIRMSDLLPANAPEAMRSAAAGVELGNAPQLGSPRTFERAEIEVALRRSLELQGKLGIPDRITVKRAGRYLAPADVLGAVQQALSGTDFRLNLQDIDVPLVAVSGGPAMVRVQHFGFDSQQKLMQFWLSVSGMKLPVIATARIRSEVPAIVPRVPVRPVLLVKPGDRVTMIVEGTGYRLSVPVQCLGPGARGQVIRVLDRHSPRIYRAKVIGTGMVQSVM